MTTRPTAEQVARRLGAPACPLCDRIGPLRVIDLMHGIALERCEDCAAAFERLMKDIETFKELTDLSDTVSKLTQAAKTLPSASLESRTDGTADERNDEVRVRWNGAAVGSSAGVQELRDRLRDVPEHEDESASEVSSRSVADSGFLSSSFAVG
jgi:hypothetical protein